MSEDEKKAKRAAYQREYYRKNRERLIAAQKERTARRDPEELKEYRRDYWEKNRERLLADQRERGKRNYRAKPDQYRERSRRSRIKSYGLTVTEFDAMALAQGGVCPICTNPMEPPVIDHCHETGRVRGLLCRPCNAAMGLLGDSEAGILRALAYLTNSSSGATSTTNSA